jgi:hypothetical protein
MSDTNPDPDRLLVDIAEAERFLRLLDPKVTKFTFQTFDDNAERKKRNTAPLKDKQRKIIKNKRGEVAKGKDPFAQNYSGTLDQRLDQLKTFNEQGAGVFVTINETDLKGRKIANIKRIRAVFVELDGAQLDPILNDPDLPKPHMVIMSSPGKWHIYWLVKELALKDFEKIQKALAKKFNGDPSVHDLPRVMRLPGFWHRKGKPFQVKIINTSDDATPYDAKEFLTKLIGDKPAAQTASRSWIFVLTIVNARRCIWTLGKSRHPVLPTPTKCCPETIRDYGAVRNTNAPPRSCLRKCRPSAFRNFTPTRWRLSRTPAKQGDCTWPILKR